MANDPELIFKLAASYEFSADLLSLHARQSFRGRETADVSEIPGFVPSAVLSAFSLELYLKCLIWAIIGKPLKWTHDAAELLRQLPPSAQGQIKTLFTEEVSTLQANGDLLLTDADGKPINYDFDSVLKANSQAFEQWRYAYETDDLMRCSCIRQLAHAVKSVILDTKPAWQAHLDARGPLPKFHG